MPTSDAFLHALNLVAFITSYGSVAFALAFIAWQKGRIPPRADIVVLGLLVVVSNFYIAAMDTSMEGLKVQAWGHSAAVVFGLLIVIAGLLLPKPE